MGNSLLLDVFYDPKLDTFFFCPLLLLFDYDEEEKEGRGEGI